MNNLTATKCACDLRDRLWNPFSKKCERCHKHFDDPFTVSPVPADSADAPTCTVAFCDEGRHPVFDNGKIVSFTWCPLRDDSAQKEAERKLTEAIAQYKQLRTASAESVTEPDADSAGETQFSDEERWLLDRMVDTGFTGKAVKCEGCGRGLLNLESQSKAEVMAWVDTHMKCAAPPAPSPVEMDRWESRKIALRIVNRLCEDQVTLDTSQGQLWESLIMTEILEAITEMK